MHANDSSRPDESALRAELLRQIGALGPGKSLCPSDIARAIAGASPDAWGKLMQPVRRVAVDLAKAGALVILRKGKLADPDAFKGVYRLAPPRQD